MKLAASCLLDHANWHRPDPGLCSRCEEEIETTEHALLRCPARQYARGPFPRSWTSNPPGMAPLQLNCSPSLSAAPSLPILRVSPSLPILRVSPSLRTTAPLPHPLLTLSLFAWVRRFLYLLLSLTNYAFWHVYISSGLFLVLSGGIFPLYLFPI